MAKHDEESQSGPDMGDGNSGSILDSESPQNTLKYKRVFSDPKMREEVSRVREWPRTQAIPPPLLSLHGERARARPVTPHPRGPESHPERPMTFGSSSRGSKPSSR